MQSSRYSKLEEHLTTIRANGFNFSSDLFQIPKAVLRGRCTRLAEDISSFRQAVEVSLKAVACGAFLAALLQDLIARDSEQQLTKPDKSPVTTADICVQAVIVDVLRSCIPTKQVRILAEEELDTLPATILHSVVDKLNSFLPLSLLHMLVDHPRAASLVPQRPTNTSELSNEWTIESILSSFNETRLNAASSNCGGVVCDNHDNGWWQHVYFIIDPIDGTKGFIRQAQFAVGLGIVDAATGDILGSIIACPKLEHSFEPNTLSHSTQFDRKPQGTGSLFYAVRGEGARYVELLSLDTPRLLQLNQAPTPVESVTFLASAERSHSNVDYPLYCFAEMCPNSHATQPTILRLDSMAKYCMLARGDGDVLLRFPNPEYHEKVWDILPGLLVLEEEAGGRVSHADGSTITHTPGEVSLTNTSGIVATSHGGFSFHKKVLKALENVREKEINAA